LVLNKMVRIAKSDFNTSRYSLNASDCIMIQVCDLASSTITTIRKTEFDSKKHSEDLTKCDDMLVWDLHSGNTVKIKVHEFNESKYSKDVTDCTPKIALSKQATNITHGGENATKRTIEANDKIQYAITSHNVGEVNSKAEFVENLADVVEYATIIDTGGGEFNNTTKQLTWPATVLKPGETQTRMFTVKVLATIPVAARGQSNPASYDCIMTNTFGNSISLPVKCPVEKQVESAVTQLPHTGAGTNVLFAAITLSVVVYFYARSRQLKKEVQLVRRELNAGTI
jgi:hypothetical protein